MFTWFIKWFILSLILIVILHYLYNFYINILTIPKNKDYIYNQEERRKNINNHLQSNTNNNIPSNINNHLQSNTNNIITSKIVNNLNINDLKESLISNINKNHK
jgi:hypothetical protein